jgi:hypothetical protein
MSDDESWCQSTEEQPDEPLPPEILIVNADVSELPPD